MKHLPIALLMAWMPLAQAHEGHGLPGSHWHSTDALGFVAVLVVVAAIWWAKRK
jgi:Co/Zn/Cd efflux system component